MLFSLLDLNFGKIEVDECEVWGDEAGYWRGGEKGLRSVSVKTTQ